MVLLKRIGTTFEWLAGVVLAAVFLAYVVLLTINWRDKPPSALVVDLTEHHQNRQHAPDEDNAYVFLLGFSSEPDTSPMELGRRRVAWLREALDAPEIDISMDPLAVDYDFKDTRDTGVENLSETCGTADAACLAALEAGSDTIKVWLSSEQWLLDRYKSLIEFNEFQETMPLDINAPFPSYSVVLEGQKLFFAQSWMLASQGDTRQVRALLDQDLIFWRMVLTNSDALITKMIATAAIKRHFKTANLIVRSLPSELIPGAVPPSWRQPITRDERSMQRSLVGEWFFMDRFFWQLTQENPDPEFFEYDSDEYFPGYALWRSIPWKILSQFWQPQDLLNLHADTLIRISKLFDVPYDDIGGAYEEATGLEQKVRRPFQGAYNLTGHLVYSENSSNFSSYVVRVTDLEGLRRVAVLVAELRARNFELDSVSSELEVASIRDPYTNEAFQWDNELNAIVFVGLEPGGRGRHVLLY